MESVWWAFKQLYEAGKIYEGEKVLMYDTKFATPVSKAEVTMDNDAYQTVTDPSVYVKFKLNDVQKPAGFDECERSYVGALLVDTNGKLIAQQRDDKPGITNPGMVSLFGGTSHEGESPIETLRRELQEELELEVNSNNLLLQTVKHENGTNVACSIYIVTGVDAEKLELHEGAGFAMGTPEELLSRPVTAVTQQAIEAFVEAQDSVSVLAWTTTPWTLPANLMLAVNPEMTYCEVLVGGEKLIIAEEALGRTLQDEKHHPLDYKVLRTFPGSELVGKKYQPLDTGSTWPENDKIHTIYAADFVSHESGTGIVHIAPAYGEDDFELAKRHGISAFHVIDDNG